MNRRPCVAPCTAPAKDITGAVGSVKCGMSFAIRTVPRLPFPLRLPTLEVLALAGRTQLRPAVRLLAVLALELDDRLDRLLAEVAGGDEQAAFAPWQDHREGRDRHVGNSVEGGANAAAEAVDPPDQVDVDLTIQVGDQVRQRVV